MPVCYGFARRSYGGDTVHAGRATVVPRKSRCCFAARRVSMSPGCFKKLGTTWATSQCIKLKKGKPSGNKA